jgi:hypothetical protein
MDTVAADPDWRILDVLQRNGHPQSKPITGDSMPCNKRQRFKSGSNEKRLPYSAARNAEPQKTPCGRQSRAGRCAPKRINIIKTSKDATQVPCRHTWKKCHKRCQDQTIPAIDNRAMEDLQQAKYFQWRRAPRSRRRHRQQADSAQGVQHKRSRLNQPSHRCNGRRWQRTPHRARENIFNAQRR